MKLKHAKILVIDDEVGMREGIKRLFELQGHHVDTAENGKEGIQKGTAFEYDIYFIDLKIPDYDGEKILKEIKEKYPESICVIMTAFATIDTAINTTRLGAYQYIAKPFPPDELQYLASRALERRWYILEARRLAKEQERRFLEVAHEKSRIKTIINAIDDGILVINQEGQVVLFNPKFLSLLNITTTLKTGHLILHHLPESLQEIIIEFIENNKPLKAIQQEIVLEPPAKLVIMANTAPIKDENGQTMGVVSVLRDITELKKIDILKSQFINMAAHELKAPLTAIQGYLEMVVEKELGDAQDIYESYLKRSLTRSKALIELINDLLNISRLEAGKVRREIKKLNICEMLEKAINAFQSEINENSINVTLDCQPDMELQADQNEIQRVFNNIVYNGIKYNKKDGDLVITAGIYKHYVKIKVKDTGIGMSETEKERIFEDFLELKINTPETLPAPA